MNKSWNPVYTKLLIGLSIIAVLCWLLHAALNSMVNRALPPEGFIFERLPVLTGVYECCGGGQGWLKSTVGGVDISCATPDYFQRLGYSYRGGAGSSELTCLMDHPEINNQTVNVERVLVPTIASWLWSQPVVSKIALKGQTVYERSDALMRSQWLEVSLDDARNIAIEIYLFLTIIYMGIVCKSINTLKI